MNTRTDLYNQLINYGFQKYYIDDVISDIMLMDNTTIDAMLNYINKKPYNIYHNDISIDSFLLSGYNIIGACLSFDFVAKNPKYKNSALVRVDDVKYE